MNCPNCKNLVEDNATVCEWCGTEFVNRNDPASALDAQLLEILSNPSMFDRAVKLYRITTGKSKWESRYYVDRLNFFRIYKYANESAWEVAWIKYRRRRMIFLPLLVSLWYTIMSFAFVWILFDFSYDKLFIPAFIFVMTYTCLGIYESYMHRQYKKYGL
jgi:hypothetical protein